MPPTTYDQAFYEGHLHGSLRSARIYLGHLFALWTPRSVVDVGCGRGAWLAAARELGAERLVGLDGDWNSPEQMLDPAIEFRAHDLDQAIALPGSFDLAMSLEVAEHLQPASTATFVESLARLSDAILFGAAFVGQPGANHINCRLHSDWAARFQARGYLLFDLFRPEFWGDDRVEPWYRQNTFLYVRPPHPLADILVRQGRPACKDARFADCIHPWLYAIALRQEAARARAREGDPDGGGN